MQCKARCANPPEKPSCERQCNQLYESLLKLCEGSSDPAACKALADETLKKCMEVCKIVTPPRSLVRPNP
ncbi:hypothetical protein DCC79_09545 [bacterium]|nr:hypothetical protein [Chloroflexi bacterium CFX6]RIL09925.1 MAG: hypothetical protein DCC79_09545 [bacterium]